MRNPIIKIDDLRIDTARKLVHRRGKLVDLTVREYALLELLAHRAGHVISRREILERLYDDETSKTSNVVDVYIGYLRRKLNSGRLKDLIHTRRGFGYLIDAPHLEVALRASA
jgi:DNA-binding response OmpR family regulator